MPLAAMIALFQHWSVYLDENKAYIEMLYLGMHVRLNKLSTSCTHPPASLPSFIPIAMLFQSTARAKEAETHLSSGVLLALRSSDVTKPNLTVPRFRPLTSQHPYRYPWLDLLTTALGKSMTLTIQSNPTHSQRTLFRNHETRCQTLERPVVDIWRPLRT
jgi:hypothetical protein